MQGQELNSMVFVGPFQNMRLCDSISTCLVKQGLRIGSQLRYLLHKEDMFLKLRKVLCCLAADKEVPICFDALLDFLF